MALIEQPVAHDDGTRQRRRNNNKRLRQAVHRHKPISRQGIQERLFTLAFSGLVYAQIWEDPLVDLEACPLRKANTGRDCVWWLQYSELSCDIADPNHGRRPQSGARCAEQAEACSHPAPARLPRAPPVLGRGRRTRERACLRGLYPAASR